MSAYDVPDTGESSKRPSCPYKAYILVEERQNK